MPGIRGVTGIDAHIHLLGDGVDPRLLDEGEQVGVTRFVGSCIGDFEAYPSAESVSAFNERMRAAMRAHPGRIEGYCYVNPRYGQHALDELRRGIEDGGMAGVKLWVATLCDDPLVFPIVERAIEYDAPILVHCWRKTTGQLPYETAPENVAALAERYPEASIIMAHLGGRAEPAVNAVAPYPNVFVDTSGTIIAAAQVSLAVERLGAERVVFGSDAPGGCFATTVGKVLGAGLGEAELDAVMGGNMLRLLEGVGR